MLLNTYSINKSNLVKKKIKKIILSSNDMKNNLEKLNKNLLYKVLNNNNLSNYINYTFSDKNPNNKKYIHKNKSNKNYNYTKLTATNKNHKFTIINDYYNTFLQGSNNDWQKTLRFSREININYKSAKNIIIMRNENQIFNKINEFTNRTYNINKQADNILYKTDDNFNNEFNNFAQSKKESKDSIQSSKEDFQDYSKKENEELKQINRVDNNVYFNKHKKNFVFKNFLPISKRIKVLKEARSSFNKSAKNNKNNSSTSFRTGLEESQQSQISNYIIGKNSKIFDINNNNSNKPYNKNDINNRRPVIIKHIPKPRLSVPKFVNINFIN